MILEIVSEGMNIDSTSNPNATPITLKYFITTSYITDTLQQFAEIAISTLLQSFVIHRESLLDVFR